MKRRRKGPNTQPGLARQHLLDKYCDVPSPHFIQTGHILYLYITAGESSRTATAREIIRYIPEMTLEQAKTKVKLLVEKTLTKYRKLTNEREFSQFEEVCSRKFCGISTTTTVPHAKSPSAEQVPKRSPLKTRQVARTNCPSCTRYKESLKNMRQKHLQMQRSKYLAIKTLRARQKNKGTIRILNQKLKRKEKQISDLKNLLKSHEAETIAKLKKQYKVKARSHMRLKKSL